MGNERLNVLLAEGDTGGVTAVLRALYPEDVNYLELTVVSGISTLIATLEVVNPELILLDLSIAQPDPLEAVRLVHRAAPEAPLIVIADEKNKQLAARCLSQGALDYLIRSRMDSATVERVLEKALEQNTLEGLANLLRDPTTGLHTRDGFLTLATHAMENAGRRESTLVLLCMLIENLAFIRGQFGPSAAESSLREIGVLLAGSFRRTDIVARLGDSQFAALAVDAIEPSGPVLRQRLEKRITVLNRDMGPWGPLELRMSVGFWKAGDTKWLPEFLDEVEAGLRGEEQDCTAEPPLPRMATSSRGAEKGDAT